MAAKKTKKSGNTKKAKAEEAPKLLYPEELNTVYSNYANISVSNRDVTVDFGLRQPQIEQGKGIIVNSRVIMSLQEAKAFGDTLLTLIAKYEKDYGEIQLAPKKKK